MRWFANRSSSRNGSRRRSRWVACAALAAALAVVPFSSALADEDVPAPPPEVSSTFDGVWEVTVNPDGAATQAGKQVFVDLVLFENGKLTASACAQYGFEPSDFTVDGSNFSSSMSSEHGTIAWNAAMANGRLSGTVLWTKADGSVFRYTLSGERYVEPPQTQETESLE